MGVTIDSVTILHHRLTFNDILTLSTHTYKTLIGVNPIHSLVVSEQSSQDTVKNDYFPSPVTDYEHLRVYDKVGHTGMRLIGKIFYQSLSITKLVFVEIKNVNNLFSRWLTIFFDIIA